MLIATETNPSNKRYATEAMLVQTSFCLKKPLSETIVINKTKSANCVKDAQRLSRLSDILNQILDSLETYSKGKLVMRLMF